MDGQTDRPTYRLTQQGVESSVRNYKFLLCLVHNYWSYLQLQMSKAKIKGQGLIKFLFISYHDAVTVEKIIKFLHFDNKGIKLQKKKKVYNDICLNLH